MKIIKYHIKKIGGLVLIIQMWFKLLEKQMINQKIEKLIN